MLTRMTDEDWAVALKVFRACRSRRGDKGRDDRKFLEAMHYFTVHNTSWRALPAEYGSWNSVWKRSWRLRQAGVFELFLGRPPPRHHTRRRPGLRRSRHRRGTAHAERPAHVAQNTNRRRSAIDKRTTRRPSYAASIRIRKRIEEAFGWIKTVAGMRKTKLRGLDKVDWAFAFTAAAYNLVRLPKLRAGEALA